MAGPTVAQVAEKVEELTRRLQQVESEHKAHRDVTDYRLKVVDQQLTDRARVEEELRNKVAELTAKNAALEERARQQEKQSDRGFNFGQAAIILGISMIGGALLSLLIQLAIKK